jgi:ATP-binding cassette subfamily C protein LapB
MTLATFQNSAVEAQQKTALKPENFKIAFSSLLLSTLAINILSLALPVMTLQIYDRILPNPGSGTLPVLIGGVCLAVFLEAVLRLCRAYMIGWSGAAYEHGLSCKAMTHMLNANPLHIQKTGVGEHLHRMASIGKLKDFYNGYALTTVAELAFVPLFLGLIFVIAGKLAFVPASILAIFALASILEGYKLRKILKKRDEADDARFNFLVEALEGIHTIKAFALEKFFERRYEALEERSSLASYKVTDDTAATFNMGTIFSHLMVASVISIGALFVLEGQLTTGTLIATLLLSGRMMQPVQRTLVLWAKYQDYALAREKLETLFAIPPYAPAGLHTEPAPEGRLRIENLSFRYAKNTPWVLKNIQLTLEPGECVLLSGAHGNGKTSLLQLISGIYPAESGQIAIDGLDLQHYPPGSRIRHVGYIRTDALIFRGTIRDNLTCFGSTDDKSAKEAASLLKVDRDVSRLPSGFDTFLSGSDTDGVPPGFKQRIAMARVLAARPGLLLFDNADNGLDREGYELVYALLAGLKGKTSLILVTEDRNMQALADRRFILENGTLHETPHPLADIRSGGTLQDEGNRS